MTEHTPVLIVGAGISGVGGAWHLTKVLALELVEHGIRVNAVAPGVIETQMTSAAAGDPARRAAAVAHVPMRRYGQPEEVANAALFLACEEGLAWWQATRLSALVVAEAPGVMWWRGLEARHAGRRQYGLATQEIERVDPDSVPQGGSRDDFD